MEKNILNKKVWGFDQSKPYSSILIKDKVWTIVEIIPAKTERNSDWCEHYLLDCNGEKLEVKYYEVVFTPDTTLPADTMSAQYLDDNGIYADVWSNGEYVVAHIDWGDWKHDHGRCNWLMSQIGYECADERVTEENGSDCYSATHYYLKSEN